MKKLICVLCIILVCVFVACSSSSGGSSNKAGDNSGTVSDSGTDTGTGTDNGDDSDTDTDTEPISELDYFNRIAYEIPTEELSISLNIKLSPDGEYGYVRIYPGYYSILVFRTSDRAVVGTIELTGTSGHENFVISPDGEYIYIDSGASLLAISTSDFSDRRSFYIGYIPQTIICSPDGEYVYTVTNSGYIFAIRSDFSEMRSIQHTGLYAGSGLITSDGRYIYNLHPMGILHVVDLNDGSVTTIDGGDDFDSYEMILSTDERFIYLASDNRIICIRTSDYAIIDRFVIDGHSGVGEHIVLDTNGEYLYVADRSGHCIFVLSISPESGLIGMVVDIIDLGRTESNFPISAQDFAISTFDDFMYVATDGGSRYCNVVVIDR